VKRYSVGMRVRLAFAVAAHLEPEILLVDEVLAVGDAAFQKKCLGKIGEVSRAGRTVIMVSHNNATIEALCTRGVVLDHGRLVYQGTAREAVDFSASTRAAQTSQLGDFARRRGSGEVRVVGLELQPGSTPAGGLIRAGQPLSLAIRFARQVPGAFPRLSAHVTVSTHLGLPIFSHANYLTGTSFGDLPEHGVLRLDLAKLPLSAGQYQVGVRLWGEMRRGSNLLDEVETAAEFTVEKADYYGSGRLPGPRDGATLVDGTWSLQPG
jgi:lipopolysaccharide transport system ATP-binding protein